MSEHRCETLTPGCHRCELGIDELEAAAEEARAEIKALDVAMGVLRDQQRELREEVVVIDKTIHRFRAASKKATR